LTPLPKESKVLCMKAPELDEADQMMVRAVGRRLVHKQFEEFTELEIGAAGAGTRCASVEW
jgi:hypothetical protein